MKTIIITILGVGVVIGGMTFIGTEEEIILETEPVVEQTAAEKFQEARNSLLEEIKVLEAERDAIDADIKAKRDLLAEWREANVAPTQVTRRTVVPQNEIERLIVQYFPEEPQKALAVAMAESGMNPRATNAGDNHGVCRGSYGIFQIGCVHGIPAEQLYDPEFNIRKARELYDQRKWQPWGAVHNGSYKQHLAYL